jgi:hypothetical protein
MRDDTIARAGSPARAVVWVGGQETSYLRAGCGAVLLLLVAEYDGPGALELIALLSTTYLVIAPQVPQHGVLGSWLANVMDGLGIATASVAAESAFVGDLLRLADECDGRVKGITELAPRGARFVPLLGGDEQRR